MTAKIKEILTQKELTVAVHIENAAADGCVCEPCKAARAAFHIPEPA